MSLALKEQREAATKRLEELAAIADERSLSDEERTEVKDLQAQLGDIAEREALQTTAAEARAAVPTQGNPVAAAVPAIDNADELRNGQGPRDVRVEQRDPGHYRRAGEGGQHSYFADMYAAQFRGDRTAEERLRENAEYVRQEMRDLSSTDSAGGYLVAPLYMQEEFIDLVKSEAVTSQLVTVRPYTPEMGDTFNIPALDTGTAVAVATENSALQETDAVFKQVSLTVFRAGGKQDISNRLLQRSRPDVDQIIMLDLSGELAELKDTWVLHGAGSTEPTGITATSDIGTATYTDASPTVPELWPQIVDALNDVATGRKKYPTHIVMHPRRWSWFLNARDSSNRPLVSAYSAQNAMGTARFEAQGLVGELLGIPVYADANITITNSAGGSTNEDQIIVGYLADCHLYEGPVSFEMSKDEKFSNDITVVRALQDVAFTAARRPSSISVVSGSGLATPSFA